MNLTLVTHTTQPEPDAQQTARPLALINGSAARTARNSETLDFTAAVIVNREQLREAYADASHVSRCLHDIADPAEIDAAELAHLCRTLHHAVRLLADVLDAKGGAAR